MCTAWLRASLLALLAAICHALPPPSGGTGTSSTTGAPSGQWTGVGSGWMGSAPGTGGLGLTAPSSERNDHTQEDEGGETPRPPMTRLSFSDLHRSSSNSYTSTCCDVVPELCTPLGRCALNVSDCVSFCICAHNQDLHWCPEELRRLQDVLERYLEAAGSDGGAPPPVSGDGGGGLGLSDGSLAAGVTGEGAGPGVADVESESLSGSSSLSLSRPHPVDLGVALGSLSFGDVGAGEAAANADSGGGLGSLTLGAKGFNPPGDGLLSPAQLASSLGAAVGGAGSLGSLGLGDVVARDTSDAPAVDASHGESGRGNKPPLPLAAMMNNKGSETNQTGGTEPGTQNGDKRGNRSSSSSSSSSRISNKTTNTNTTTRNPDVGLNNNNNTDGNPATEEAALPWWPDGNDEDDSCGEECTAKGGRCVFDFKETYTQVCVYDSVQPCHKFNCVHGECEARNGSYSCECTAGWTGIFCNKPCSLDCGPNGHCVVMGGDPACECQHNYTGVRCDELKPTPIPWRGYDVDDDAVAMWQIAAACLGVAAGLLVTLLLFAYVTWRKQWLPIRKFVHYFQQYEEDDGKEYDAFVSYRSASRDEQFVLHELYPHLERHLDFKLCMHFRDFPPGETIADNIIQAIENSRRTILVLSPAYVQSEWCRLEYQKAQHEMLKLRHKIIPVMLEDVTHVEPVDRNLRTILDTVTYIKWPGNDDSKRAEKFWKLLQLSMPKRKSDYSRSLSSAGSCSSDRPLTAVSTSCFHNVVTSMSESLHPQRSLSITSSLEEVEEEGEGVEEEEGEVGSQQKCNVNRDSDEVCRDSDGYSDRCHFEGRMHCRGGDCSKNGDRCFEGHQRCDSDCSKNSDSGCPRDRTSSSDSDGDPPYPGRRKHSSGTPTCDEPTHVTSDDHIVEIRELSGDQVKITPWLPARMSTNF